MNDKLNESLNQDQLDQQELDAAYNELNGITEETTDHEEPKTSTKEVTEDVFEDQVPGENTNDEDPLADILDNGQQKPSDEQDTSDQEEKKDDEHSDDYVDLEDSPEDDEDTLIKADDPVGVQKRIGKEVQRRKALEATVSEIKQQNEQLMRMMMGQAPQQAQFGSQQMMPNGQSAAPQPSTLFVPPALPKPYEEMNEYERFNYFQQVNNAESQAKQVYAEQQMQQQKFNADIDKTISAIKRVANEKGDKVLSDLVNIDRGHYTPHMMAALSDYPNAASLTRHFHTKHNAELAILKNQSTDAQMRGIVRMAERVNLERQQTFQKKAQAKKPIPAGKLQSANLPNTKGKKDIYSAEFLESLSPEQWDKLVAKGY